MKTDPQDGEMSTWCDWEVHFFPYPRTLRELGFDAVLERISDAVWDDPAPLARWGDVGLSGQLECVITVSIAKAEDQQPEDFMQDVAQLMLKLGLEGHMMIHQVYNVMRSPMYDGECDG